MLRKFGRGVNEMQNNGLIKGVMTVGAIGAAAGLAYAAMTPRQQKRLERSLKKTSDQLADIMDSIHDRAM